MLRTDKFTETFDILCKIFRMASHLHVEGDEMLKGAV